MKLPSLPIASRFLVATTASALLAVTALAQVPAPGAPATTPTAPEPAAKPLSPIEKNFLRNSGQSINYLLKLAEAGKNPAVKEDKHTRFRDKAITDLKKAWEGLNKTASARGETIEGELAGTDKSEIERMAKLKDDRFLKAWLDEMAKEAKKLDRDFQSAERSVQDPEVKMFVSNYTPIVRTIFTAAETQEKGLKKK